MNLYENLATQLKDAIRQGVYPPGDRVPSVRRLSEQHRVSQATVVSAYRLLESHGWLEARPQSGFFARQPEAAPPAAQAGDAADGPCAVNVTELAVRLSRNTQRKDLVSLGAAVPHADFLPLKDLRAVAKAGDIIAIESPAFFGTLQAIESLGMQALEIPSDPDTGIDIYLGQGGAPEGVLAAAALRCVGGQIQTRLVFRNDDERTRAHRIGITDLNRKYKTMDLASGDVMFAATGVTDGSMLEGIHKVGNFMTSHTIVMRSKTRTVRWIKARHVIKPH